LKRGESRYEDKIKTQSRAPYIHHKVGGYTLKVTEDKVTFARRNTKGITEQGCASSSSKKFKPCRVKRETLGREQEKRSNERRAGTKITSRKEDDHKELRQDHTKDERGHGP
jgi:hypothetical protein